MPIFKIVTNLPKSKFTNDFILKFSMLAEELTQRDVGTTELLVLADQIVTFHRTNDPAAIVSISAIHCAPVERRAKISRRLHDFLVAELGLDSNRFYILYHTLKTNEVALNGRLYSDDE